MRTPTLPQAARVGALAALLAACGGGDILAIVSFVGSVGGDWTFDNPQQAGFQARTNCGPGGNEPCVINIQPIGGQNIFASDFALSYTGTLPGCPTNVARTDGRASGTRITLPGCFSGNYVTINEALADNGVDRAFFDSAVPSLAEGVWVEIQAGQRRFKFNNNASGCELTTPRTPVAVTITPADIPARLQTTIDAFTVGALTYSGSFVGMSGMRLTRGSEVLELERRDLAGAC
jgi:hypothetical protein